MLGDEQRQSVAIGGVKLEIIATQIGDNEWELSVVDSLGIRATWLEWFASAEQAVDAALRAIESEGVQAFTDIEGFEYLLDE